MSQSLRWIATAMSRISVLVAIALAACSDEADDVDYPCHVDCFGGAECDGDRLKLHGLGGRPIECGAPIPVDYCVQATTTCAMGCKGDAFVPGRGVSLTGEYDWLCRPAPPAAVGRSCATDDDCHPTFAIPTTSNEVTQVYLGCGPAGTCEEIAAPVVPGYGDPCPAGPGDTVGDVRWIEGAVAGDACLFATELSCARTFATRECAGDWECPAGSRCDDQIVHATGELLGGVCRPLAAPLRALDLPCTP